MAANRRCAAFVRDVFVDWEIMNVPFTEVAVATDSASTGSYQVDRNFGRPVRYFLRELEAAEDVLVPRSRPKVGDCLIALRWLSCKKEDTMDSGGILKFRFGGDHATCGDSQKKRAN
jgi:hypothetical protein